MHFVYVCVFVSICCYVLIQILYAIVSAKRDLTYAL